MNYRKYIFYLNPQWPLEDNNQIPISLIFIYKQENIFKFDFALIMEVPSYYLYYNIWQLIVA